MKEGRLNNTTLDDSAEIYQQREQQTEKQKLSEMTFKEKVTYFNNYYRTPVIIVVVVLVFAGYLAYSILKPSAETVLYAAIVNNVLDDNTVTKLQTGFADHLAIDPKKQDVLIDSSFNLGTGDDANEYTISNQQKLTTYFYAGEIDVIIAPESLFAGYAKAGTFSKLSDQLPSDLCSAMTDDFYYAATEDDPNSGAYGIYLDSTPVYSKLGQLTDRPVLGIVANSKYKENAVEFIRYLFQLKD